jgi:hypothetical protein
VAGAVVLVGRRFASYALVAMLPLGSVTDTTLPMLSYDNNVSALIFEALQQSAVFEMRLPKPS